MNLSNMVQFFKIPLKIFISKMVYTHFVGVLLFFSIDFRFFLMCAMDVDFNPKSMDLSFLKIDVCVIN
jgi:hypothetical protein